MEEGRKEVIYSLYLTESAPNKEVSVPRDSTVSLSFQKRDN